MKAALFLSGLGAVAGSFMLLTILAVLNALGPGAPSSAHAYAGHLAAPRGIVAAAVAHQPPARMTRIAEGG